MTNEPSIFYSSGGHRLMRRLEAITGGLVLGHHVILIASDQKTSDVMRGWIENTYIFDLLPVRCRLRDRIVLKNGGVLQFLVSLDSPQTVPRLRGLQCTAVVFEEYDDSLPPPHFGVPGD